MTTMTTTTAATETMTAAGAPAAALPVPAPTAIPIQPTLDDAAIVATLERVIASGGPMMVFQPIHLLLTGDVIGAESLARFPVGLTTKEWFAAADRLGLGDDLELSAVHTALCRLDAPTWRRMKWDFVTVNISPRMLFDPRFDHLLFEHPDVRLMVEVTDQTPGPEYRPLATRLDALREVGVRIAVDAVTCDPSNLRRVLDIDPEVVKLDVDFTAALVRDPARHDLAAGLLRQCQRNGAFVVAVGVEHEAELAVLRDLGVDAVQGHFFGQPGAIERSGARPVLPGSPRW